MKNTIRTLVLALAMVGATVSLTPMTGCSVFEVRDTQERKTYFEWQEAYTLAAGTLVAAYDAGEIDQDDWDTIWNPAIQAGNRALDEMEAAIASDNAQQFNLGRFALGEALVILERWAQ